MRFVLDHDVDIRVGQVIRRAGQTCWRAPEGLAGEGRDDELSVYAEEKEAIVVTHDREFTQRRQRNTFGQHVRLVCPHPEAVPVVTNNYRPPLVNWKPEAKACNPPQWE
jgi:predicted nuclease of predicted toxin-antitoxin system